MGGNITVQLQMQAGHTTNEIGSRAPVWHDVPVYMPGSKEPGLTGFLDLSGETTSRSTFNAKIQESTHIFICDYVPIPAVVEIEGVPVRVTTENIRIVAQGQPYDIMLMDNPMFLNKQWEIYLKFTGGQ